MEPMHIWMRYEKARALAVRALFVNSCGHSYTAESEEVYDALELAFLWRSAAEAGTLRNIREMTREQMIEATNG